MALMESFLQTASTLQGGSAQQKAQTIAQLVNHYGVDINELDQSLVGGSNDPQQAQMEQLIKDRMAPYDQMVQQMAQQQDYQQQQVQVQADTDVKTFSEKAEFLSDVRIDMADMIDAAARQGRNMGLQEAYQKACTLNPQIMAVLTQRQQAKQLQGSAENIAAKREAASSLSGKMAGSGGGSGSMSLHDTLARAWDDQAHG